MRTRNFFQDVGTGLKSLVGGEVKNLTKLTALMRDELVEEAKGRYTYDVYNILGFFDPLPPPLCPQFYTW